MVRTNKSIQLNTPHPQLTKCGIITLEESPCRKPLKLSSVKYYSPLGNVSQPKKKKKKKSFPDQPISDVPIAPFFDVQENKAKSRLLREQETANTLDVIVIQDTPERMQNQKSLLHKAVKNSRSHSTMETDNSDQNGSNPIIDLSDTPDKCNKRKSKKQKIVLHDVRRLCDISETSTRNSEPRHDSGNTQPDHHSDDCVNVGLESSMGTDNSAIKKKKKKKRKSMQMLEQDVNSSIANEPIVADHSPPKKERKVLLLGDNTSTKKLLTVSIQNDTEDASSDNDIEVTPSNVTIDLEPDSVESVSLSAPDVAIIAEGKDTPKRRKKKARRSGLSDTITLSDGEDDTQDIIVLGSPVVPSVKSYKEIKTRKPLTTGYQPITIGPIRPSRWDNMFPIAQSFLSLTVERNRMKGNTQISRIPPRGIKTTVSSTNANQTVSSTNANQTVSSTNAEQAAPPSPADTYGSNLYNPSGSVVKKTGLRPIIIDGSNIAMGHGNGRCFSCRGIEICVNYFEKKGHKVFAFVPQFRRNSMNTKDAHILERLGSYKTVIFTPSRKVNGKIEAPYDDRYIVQTAAELGGVIVSTDNYRDLLSENQAWHDVIKNRLLMFTWVEDLLIFPQDPLGKRGGDLETFLRFPEN